MDLPIVERTTRNCLTIRCSGVREGWSQRFLLTADVHYDNPLCRRNLLHKHLREAQQAGALWLNFGDLYCAMQGKYDKRADKSKLRREHQVDDYLDALVNTTAADLLPYQDIITVLSDGNHETSIRRHHETDLLERLCFALTSPEHKVHHMGYSGWVRFMFQKPKGRGGRTQRKLYFHHGRGGSAVVTKGVIDTNRRSAYLRGADIVVSGHIHEEWAMNTPQYGITDAGRECTWDLWHIQLATYKDEFTPEGGYHTEQGRAPKPIGGRWIEFRYSTDKLGHVDMLTWPAK